MDIHLMEDMETVSIYIIYSSDYHNRFRIWRWLQLLPPAVSFAFPQYLIYVRQCNLSMDVCSTRKIMIFSDITMDTATTLTHTTLVRISIFECALPHITRAIAIALLTINLDSTNGTSGCFNYSSICRILQQWLWIQQLRLQ